MKKVYKNSIPVSGNSKSTITNLKFTNGDFMSFFFLYTGININQRRKDLGLKTSDCTQIFPLIRHRSVA